MSCLGGVWANAGLDLCQGLDCWPYRPNGQDLNGAIASDEKQLLPFYDIAQGPLQALDCDGRGRDFKKPKLRLGFIKILGIF